MYPIGLLLATLALLACGKIGDEQTRPQPGRPAGAGAAAAAAAAETSDRVVAFLGDSLTAGYGVAEEEAFPAIVGERLRERGIAVRIVNAGVSGDTTAGGLSRVSWVLEQHPDILVVGLGANDALRGQPIDGIERNLRAIVRAGKEQGVKVLLLGIRIPTNYGRVYAGDLAAVYPRIARSLDVPLVPFLLEGVGGHADLNLDDGVHPNPRGHEIVADNVFPYLEKMLSQ
jgi:acyl-CoA thioesterase-1